MHQFIPNCILFLLIIRALSANCCIEHERQALLKFKGSLNDPSGRLASWTGEKCCNWTGIRCSNQKGHVVKLNLRNSDDEANNNSLSGEINPALLLVSDLKHLDLSCNNFTGNILPEFSSSFKNLKYLNLSSTSLSGLIPPQLGNLSKLQYLDLSSLPLTSVSSLWWLIHLTSLKYLDMSMVYIRDSKEWLQALSMLPLLHTLKLSENKLTSIPPSINLVNFSSLEVLYIQDNCFNTVMPDWIGKLPNLIELQLLDCCFTGPIPNHLGNLSSLNCLNFKENLSKGPMPPLYNLKNLTHLYIVDVDIGEDIRDVVGKLAKDTFEKLEGLALVDANLRGNLSGWLIEMPNIKFVDLSSNNLTGSIPTNIHNLIHLEYLYLCENSFTGNVSEDHFTGLSKLKGISLLFNFVKVTLRNNWIPPFQIEHLLLGTCSLGPSFPYWLQNQSRLLYIDISANGIIGTEPDWFWNFPSLFFVNISVNSIEGKLPSLEHLTQLNTLYLQSNNFEGRIPSLPNSLEYVELSNNSFQGAIEKLTCGLDHLTILNLAENKLSGNLPLCWSNTLMVVNMAHNNFSGVIPSSLGSLSSLRVLQLNNNSLNGELPLTLKLCRNLVVLDIGENKLSGQIPEWIGEGLKNLQILRLRSNMFSGEIPTELLLLTNLHVLDLARNHISGSIPYNLEFLRAMGSITGNNIVAAYPTFKLSGFIVYYVIDYTLSTLLVTKDVEQSYTTNLLLFKSIDLSSNNLTGEIPHPMIALQGLINLNLSNNHLHGPIPMQIGHMQSIESLDLSMNELSGMIPQSLASLNFLSTLNLSYNNLSGDIPTGNQLQTLNNPYNFIGNDYLCGPPLNKSCVMDKTYNGCEQAAGYNVDEVLLCLFLIFGFALGFWVICGILIFKANWRRCFCRIIDNWFDKLYAFIRMHAVIYEPRKEIGSESVWSF